MGRQHGVGAAVGVVCWIHHCWVSVTLSRNFAWFLNLLIELFFIGKLVSDRGRRLLFPVRATGEQQELGKYKKLFPERLGISQLNLWQFVGPAAVGHQGSLGPC